MPVVRLLRYCRTHFSTQRRLPNIWQRPARPDGRVASCPARTIDRTRCPPAVFLCPPCCLLRSEGFAARFQLADATLKTTW